MNPGDLVISIMDLPSQQHYEEIGVVLRIRKPRNDQFPYESRIRYDILVGDVVLKDQLYEYFYEVEPPT